MKFTARGYLVGVLAGGLGGFFPMLRAELTPVQQRQAQESTVAMAADRFTEANKLQPADASPADRAAWLERRGRWLLRDDKLVEAEKDFLAAKKLTPTSVPAAAGLAEVAQRLGRKKEAMALILAVAELRKDEDPNAQFYGIEPGVPHIFLQLQEMNSGGVTENTVEVFALGDALPDALLMAARNAAANGDVATALQLSTRAIAEVGGKFPAGERLRQVVSASLARANAMEPTSPKLGKLRFFAETQLAKGEVYMARRAAEEALKSGRELPTFGERQLLFARAVAAVVLKDKPGPRKISEVDADTLEATRIFASAPELDAAAVAAETALAARLRQIDPFWPAGTLPAPAKLTVESPLVQALTVEPLRAGSARVVALENVFLAEWGRGPTAVDLETAEGRTRWGKSGREGALIAHLRWLTSPAESKEANAARTDARQRTILALLCVPEDAAAMGVAKAHAWFTEAGGRSYVSGKPGEFTQKLNVLLAGKQAKDSAPPENPEELSALLRDVMPLAEGTIDLASTAPGIAAAVAVRVTDVVGQLRMKRQEDVAFIASPLAKFVGDWTKDPARALDVADWGVAQQKMPSAQVRYAYEPPAGLERTPLGRHVLALDAWLWSGAEAKTEPVTPATWAKLPSVVWRHALGSSGAGGNFKRLMEANRHGAWGMSLSVSSSAGQLMHLLDKRLGDRVVATMNAPAAAEWFNTLAETDALLKEPGVMPEVRTRLGKQLELHRAQVLIAAGQRELAKKNMPEIVARLESPPPAPRVPKAPREEQGIGLAGIAREQKQAREKQELHDRVMKKEREIAEAKRVAQEAEYARTHKPVVVVKVCPACNGQGGAYNRTWLPADKVLKKTDSYGMVSYSSFVDNWVKCGTCYGKSTIETVQSK